MWVFEKHINLFFVDETDQVIQVYAHMYEIFHSGSFSLWDSNVGLAASSFVHFWTVLGLPSFYLFLLLSKHYFRYSWRNMVYIFKPLNM